MQTLDKKLKHSTKQVEQVRFELKRRNDKKADYRQDLNDAQKAQIQKKQQVDEDKKEIEQKKRERDLLNKTVATEEENFREQE